MDLADKVGLLCVGFVWSVFLNGVFIWAMLRDGLSQGPRTPKDQARHFARHGITLDMRAITKAQAVRELEEQWAQPAVEN